ncbi:Oidioi.mRNA.OKI2018_I69.PAR.g9657.t1.cds [Oikopleura dioica]|uniref:Oidioi.mRNA.OKI2018_I69.PAR.g9657.t1.cds n=1 Tax=Oikopleura dioica TaxID=34765 RepID=A0ABN7RQ76_OIKDI|nr:Oidioi.mRNA.OKI2018_I69.PAR.g9657.t1.cds [Oikopleura dioica]
MFFNDPFYTTSFRPNYSSMAQYADRTCNCPDCRPPRRQPRQQQRRTQPVRQQQRLFQDPFFEEFQPSRTVRQERPKKNQPSKANNSQSKSTKPPVPKPQKARTKKKPVEIPVEIVKEGQPVQEKVGDRKILTNMENLVIEELSTPIEIKEDPFYADEEIVIE